MVSPGLNCFNWRLHVKAMLCLCTVPFKMKSGGSCLIWRVLQGEASLQSPSYPAFTTFC